MYHVALDLSPDQVKQLKRRALDLNKKVKDLVTQLVIREIEHPIEEQK